MTKNEDDKNLTTTERVQVKKQGNSKTLRFPAKWQQTIPALAHTTLIFEIHLEKQNGKVMLIGELVNEKPNQTH